MGELFSDGKAAVSIIIPVFNGENYLKQAIDSALSQTYPDVEVIVVDDGSTDGTAHICRSYGDSIRYFYKENGGVASAVNFGIRKMRGEYFSWLSHDDIYHPDKIEKQIKALECSSDKTTIVHGNFNITNEKYHGVTCVRNDVTYTKERMENSVFPVLLTAIHGCVPLIHRSHFERAGVFDESLPLTQDYDFFFRVMRGTRSVFLPEPLVDVRLHKMAGRNTSPDFERACARQYIYFAKNLSLSEIREMFGDETIFYFRTACMAAARGFLKMAADFLSDVSCPKAGTYDFKARVREYVGYVWDKVVIFGCGFQGKSLYFELLGRGVRADSFTDNNVGLYGQTIMGIPCSSPDAFIENRKDTLMIVSPDDSDGIVGQLSEMGFCHVTTRKQLEELFLRNPPFKTEVFDNEMDEQRS